jgi:hypothetical protein
MLCAREALEEGLTLDYKASAALSREGKGPDEMCKDVTALANSVASLQNRRRTRRSTSTKDDDIRRRVINSPPDVPIFKEGEVETHSAAVAIKISTAS